jgi:hypothetical protein
MNVKVDRVPTTTEAGALLDDAFTTLGQAAHDQWTGASWQDKNKAVPASSPMDSRRLSPATWRSNNTQDVKGVELGATLRYSTRMKESLREKYSQLRGTRSNHEFDKMIAMLGRMEAARQRWVELPKFAFDRNDIWSMLTLYKDCLDERRKFAKRFLRDAKEYDLFKALFGSLFPAPKLVIGRRVSYHGSRRVV